VSETDDCSVSNDLLLHMQCKKICGKESASYMDWRLLVWMPKWCVPFQVQVAAKSHFLSGLWHCWLGNRIPAARKITCSDYIQPGAVPGKRPIIQNW